MVSESLVSEWPFGHGQPWRNGPGGVHQLIRVQLLADKELHILVEEYIIGTVIPSTTFSIACQIGKTP